MRWLLGDASAGLLASGSGPRHRKVPAGIRGRSGLLNYLEVTNPLRMIIMIPESGVFSRIPSHRTNRVPPHVYGVDRSVSNPTCVFLNSFVSCSSQTMAFESRSCQHVRASLMSEDDETAPGNIS